MDSQVDEIKLKLDVVDVISGYVRLTQSGANFKACCPFHNEKTASFVVSREKQIWHCFGCQKGGSIFDFVMEMEGVEFKEALRILAGKAGVALKKQNPKLISQRNKVLDCLDSASRFFYQVLLKADQAEHARMYLKDRNVNDVTVDDFKLGYAPDTWDALYNGLRKKGFYANDIERAGLIIKKQNGGYYDRFRNRIMFPIKDINGNVVGFSGRVLPVIPPPTPPLSRGGAKKFPPYQGGKQGGFKDLGNTPAKYINSPQTDVFDKSRIIYGLDKARNEMRKNNLAIIVEGQMDVIASHQAGVKNAAACSGTALTAEHIKIIKRYTNNIALCFDMDEAGKKAARRAVDIALQAEMNVKHISIPGGKDPDECIRINAEDWKSAITNVKPFMDYYFKQILAGLDVNNIEEKREAVRQILMLISKMNNKVEQIHYLQKLANETNVQESVLREILSLNKDKQRQYPRKVGPQKSNLQRRDHGLQVAERVIAFGIAYFENFSYIADHLSPEFLPDERLTYLYNQLIIYYTELQQKNPYLCDLKLDLSLFGQILIDKSGDVERKKYLDTLWFLGKKEIDEFEDQGETFNGQKARLEIEKGINWLKDNYNKKRLNQLKIEIEKAEKVNNKMAIEELSKEVGAIMKDLKGRF